MGLLIGTHQRLETDAWQNKTGANDLIKPPHRTRHALGEQSILPVPHLVSPARCRGTLERLADLRALFGGGESTPKKSSPPSPLVSWKALPGDWCTSLGACGW